MRTKSLVKISNIIGIVSIILLVFWVFITITIEAFNFKVFEKNTSEIFYMSIFGILSLMAGALMINIMLNLSRIADKPNTDNEQETKKGKKIGLIFLLSFPLIFAFLAGADYMTTKHKEKELIVTAKSIVSDQKNKIDKIADYSFNASWLQNTKNSLRILSDTDKNFPRITVIIKDRVDDTDVYLEYTPYMSVSIKDTASIDKRDYILKTTKKEREYFEQVFSNNTDDIHFDRNDGYYELFHPYSNGGKNIVIHFSERESYGSSYK